ncbi:hypothetical protein [Pseudarthrobacter sp. NIBRBAC000502770]|uniref:hypothetical protein n=1 Tax=Pseudarthrobacter sp. NIBRBAC000502770 TaxID=2590785 RepID=UPI00113FE40D|nr:hypothetical protein [Pseudarthrobacter sp. NIBRBAC000502770]QDG88868.1 hypothetical protein NIBR502770_10560 [Pseudarthrobacter sp. NIBRBAC000502770]
MAAPRKPQDRQTKAVNDSAETEPFEFEHHGQTYTLASADTLDAGFARKNRKLAPDDQFFTVLEALADDETLAAIDSMRKQEFEQFQKAFFAHSGIELGE